MLPAVTDEPTGYGANDMITVIYDLDGRPVWTQDADGYIGYTQYDPATGAVVEQIQDVDTTIFSSPGHRAPRPPAPG